LTVARAKYGFFGERLSSVRTKTPHCLGELDNVAEETRISRAPPSIEIWHEYFQAGLVEPF